jgi:hypothetical protein
LFGKDKQNMIRTVPVVFGNQMCISERGEITKENHALCSWESDAWAATSCSARRIGCYLMVKALLSIQVSEVGHDSLDFFGFLWLAVFKELSSV